MQSEDLIWGSVADLQLSLPLTIQVLLCDLRPRFIAKGRVGKGYRAIARNGRVLLATDRPLEEMADLLCRLRLQAWHRAILPGDPAEPYGTLVCARGEEDEIRGPIYGALLAPVNGPRRHRAAAATFDLALAVGGGLRLEFRLSGSGIGPEDR
jgi:hypothetical protein